jgi:hypothetical protein
VCLPAYLTLSLPWPMVRLVAYQAERKAAFSPAHPALSLPWPMVGAFVDGGVLIDCQRSPKFT